MKQLRMRLVRIFKRLLLVVFGVAMAWLMLEIMLRVGFNYLPPGIQGNIQEVQRVPWSDEKIILDMPWVIDHDFQLRLPPGLVDFPVHWSDAQFTFSTISAWDGHRAGLRSDPPRWPLDVVTIGDSFTFCWTAYEDCWVHRLQSDYDWHIFNGGIPGTGTTAQYNLLREIVPPLKPKIVIWEWYNNDVTDDYDLAHLRGETPDLVGGPQPDPVPALTGLSRYSAVWAILQAKFNPPKSISPYKHTQIVTANGHPLLIHTNEYTFPSNLVYPQNAYGWTRSVQSRASAAALLQGMGTKMVLIAMPVKEEAYADYLVGILGQPYLDGVSETRLKLLDECKANGWDCIDPLPAFKDAIKNGQNVYYDYDQHLDASGNQILEKVVHDYIEQHGLLNK